MGISVISSAPVASVAYFPMAAAPSGWLKANGAAVSRSAYAALFALIGTTFGAGDGATTFNLPDLRGEFVRGLDDGRGVDAGRALGSAQGDAFQDHVHNFHIYQQAGAGAGVARNGTGNGPGLLDTYGATAGATTETRPRNVALLPCIKF